MDTVYPEHLSVLYKRAVRKTTHKTNAARYRTQPVTFSEIQEVDEENVEDSERKVGTASKSELDLKAKFEEFKRQRDRDLRENRLGGQSENVILTEATESNGNCSNNSPMKTDSNQFFYPSNSSFYQRSSTQSRPSI